MAEQLEQMGLYDIVDDGFQFFIERTYFYSHEINEMLQKGVAYEFDAIYHYFYEAPLGKKEVSDFMLPGIAVFEIEFISVIDKILKEVLSLIGK